MRSTTPASDPEDGANPYAAPTTQAADGPTPVVAAGGASWRIFLVMGIVSGTFFWLFWSAWMSVLMRHDLVSILVGPGAACGLFFGVFFGGFMAIMMRPAAITFPVGDEDEFLSRLDGEMAKLRYRPLGGTDGLRTYGPRTLFRPHAFDIVVRIESGEAAVTGPKASLKAMKKRLERRT